MKKLMSVLLVTMATQMAWANDLRVQLYIGTQEAKSGQAFEVLKVVTNKVTEEVDFFKCSATARQIRVQDRTQLSVTERPETCVNFAYSNLKAIEVHRDTVTFLIAANAWSALMVPYEAVKSLGVVSLLSYKALASGAVSGSALATLDILWNMGMVLYYGAPVIGGGLTATVAANIHPELRKIAENVSTQYVIMNNILDENKQSEIIVTNDYQRLKAQLGVVVHHAAREVQ